MYLVLAVIMVMFGLSFCGVYKSDSSLAPFLLGYYLLPNTNTTHCNLLLDWLLISFGFTLLGRNKDLNKFGIVSNLSLLLNILL